MAKYLLISSRDPYEFNDARDVYELASNLKEQGNDVTLFLVQNGVLPARPGRHSQSLADLASSGIEVLADEFSLRERAIDAGKLANGVKSAPISAVVDELGAGSKALWH